MEGFLISEHLLRKLIDMRNIFFCFLVLVTSITHCQTIKGIIKDSISEETIPYVNIVLLQGGGTYSNEKGEFTLKVKENKPDTLMVSILGYSSIKLPIQPSRIEDEILLDLLLTPKTETLDEVIVVSKKKKYNKKIRLGEHKNGNIGVTSLIGYETCILITNPKKEKGKIKKVFIDLKRRKNADFTAIFNIKFYSYNQENDSPGELLYTKNIYVKPKNRKYRFWINVNELDIPFPENAVCIGVEMINGSGHVKKYTKFGPMFRYTITKSKTKVWSNYHNTGWKNANINRKNNKIETAVPIIGIEALF